MSDVSGIASSRISYTDSTAVDAKSISHQIALSEDARSSAGIVAVMSGTVGTAVASISLDPTTYVNSQKEFVSFDASTQPTRIALQSPGSNTVRLFDNDLGIVSIFSANNVLAMTTWGGGATVESGLSIQASSGTNSYTVFVARDE